MTKTPQTDEAEIDSSEFSDWGTGKSGYVHADFARELEESRDKHKEKSEERRKVLIAYEEAYLTLPSEYRVAFSNASCAAYREEGLRMSNLDKALKEIKSFCSSDNQTIRFAFGEMTAAEMRTLRAGFNRILRNLE